MKELTALVLAVVLALLALSSGGYAIAKAIHEYTNHYGKIPLITVPSRSDKR